MPESLDQATPQQCVRRLTDLGSLVGLPHPMTTGTRFVRRSGSESIARESIAFRRKTWASAGTERIRAARPAEIDPGEFAGFGRGCSSGRPGLPAHRSAYRGSL